MGDFFLSAQFLRIYRKHEFAEFLILTLLQRACFGGSMCIFIFLLNFINFSKKNLFR